jgi:hypothetical protein
MLHLIPPQYRIKEMESASPLQTSKQILVKQSLLLSQKPNIEELLLYNNLIQYIQNQDRYMHTNYNPISIKSLIQLKKKKTQRIEITKKRVCERHLRKCNGSKKAVDGSQSNIEN